MSCKHKSLCYRMVLCLPTSTAEERKPRIDMAEAREASLDGVWVISTHCKKPLNAKVHVCFMHLTSVLPNSVFICMFANANNCRSRKEESIWCRPRPWKHLQQRLCHGHSVLSTRVAATEQKHNNSRQYVLK